LGYRLFENLLLLQETETLAQKRYEYQQIWYCFLKTCGRLSEVMAVLQQKLENRVTTSWTLAWEKSSALK
jgi:hypothetical protein